jgi:hypothetical protein
MQSPAAVALIPRLAAIPAFAGTSLTLRQAAGAEPKNLADLAHG